MYTIFDEEKEEYIKVEEPDHSLTYTYADYLKWSFEERLELFKGKISQLSAPNTLHQKLLGKLYLRIGGFLEKESCQVFVAPFDVRLPGKNGKADNKIVTVVQPDLCVVCDPEKIDKRGCCGAPDLLIEVLSPGNSKKEVRTKFELYEEAGVLEYWIVNPVEQNIFISTLDENNRFCNGTIYADGDKIETAIISGLVIDVSDIFTH